MFILITNSPIEDCCWMLTGGLNLHHVHLNAFNSTQKWSALWKRYKCLRFSQNWRTMKSDWSSWYRKSKPLPLLIPELFRDWLATVIFGQVHRVQETTDADQARQTSTRGDNGVRRLVGRAPAPAAVDLCVAHRGPLQAAPVRRTLARRRVRGNVQGHPRCVVVTVCHLDMGWSMRAEGKQKDPRLDLELTPLPPKRQADKVIIIGSHHPSLLPDGRYNLQTCPYQRYISYLTRLPFPHTEDPFISYLFIYTASQFSYVALY